MKRFSFAGLLLALAALFVTSFNTSIAGEKSCCTSGSCCTMKCCTNNCSACCSDGKCTMNCCDTKSGLSGGAQDSLHNHSDSVKTTNTISTPPEGYSTCPVSGENFKQGKGVSYTYLGKQYEFCCEDCAAAFKKEPINYDAGILCPVMGEAASKDASVEYNGTKYYFCCNPCIKKFNSNPEKYLDGYKEK